MLDDDQSGRFGSALKPPQGDQLDASGTHARSLPGLWIRAFVNALLAPRCDIFNQRWIGAWQQTSQHGDYQNVKYTSKSNGS